MIIVTGGAGFIGSNIVAGLENNGYKDIVIIDSLNQDNNKWQNISKRMISEIILPEDTFEFLDNCEDKIEAIIHLGAINSYIECPPDDIVNTNFGLSLDLWDWCVENKVRFIYASSADTYGNGEHGFEDKFSSAELAKLKQLTPYAWSKHLFDRKICSLVEEGRPTPPQYVGLKLFDVYGPNEYHKGRHKSIVAQAFPFAKDDKYFSLFRSHNLKYENGKQIHDFIWVGDVVDVVLWALQNKKINGLFNLGSGDARSFYDLVANVYKALGKEPKIDFVDMPENLRGQYQYLCTANIEKLREAGYNKPMTSIEQGIYKYVTEFLNTEDNYL